ncbi:MAG TPA: Stp1/IreP family PP2C-type Ser/Thr phosphatase [Thermoleophilaceae bacterium]|nr:Stp1/IreP family PP2C-type Ser/Thr phosphatase [Thermoleophilaceae bacterium]
MALTIIERAALTDVGRQRSANEDSFVEAPPFFAVADGMGGAKAGEVASQIAVEAFDSADEAPEQAEARLRDIAQSANRRIYDLAQAEESRRGMGTTLTAALVGPDGVSLGHVGDSRGYLLRDGELEQLTRDHSLVAELERTGQIAPGEAEHHPQRSIITRALGPERDVDVDTYTINGRPGDVFLLCSDGLTSMISNEEMASILRSADSLQETAEALVRSANQSGGKDNITVVLFRLADDADGADEADGAAAGQTIAGGLHADDVAAAAADAPTLPPAAADAPTLPPSSAPGKRAREPDPPRTTTSAVPARRRRGGEGRLRRGVGSLVTLLIVVAILAGLYLGSRQVYFLGTDDAGLVTMYRGLPYELPLGIDLYSDEYASGVPARAIPAERRKRVLDHEWRGRDDASDLMRQLERGRIEGTG